MVSSRESWPTRIWKKPSTVSGTPTDIVDDRGRADCCTGEVGSRIHNRALAGWGRYRCLHGSMPCLFGRTCIKYYLLFSQSRNRCTSTVFVRRSLDPAVLISLPMVCGRNALARVRQGARTPLVGWLVALPQVELNTTLTICMNRLGVCGVL